MQFKKLVRISLTAILFLQLVVQFNPFPSEAASSKVGYVSISSGVLNVRSGPGSKYKVIGSLKNNTSISVYSQSKDGWSQIGYKKGKAYVSSQHLRMYSYLRDKTKNYIYKENGQSKFVSYEGTYNGWQRWRTQPQSYVVEFKEDSTGLYTGYPESEYEKDIAYPLKTGNTWISFETKYKITSTNYTLKTQAGTFKNVVVVKGDDSYVGYYAPNVGIIKATYNNRVTFELIEIVKKK